MDVVERLFVACGRGLDGGLGGELSALGARVERRLPSGVEVSGPSGLHRTVVLHSRIASAVALELESGPVAEWRAESFWPFLDQGQPWLLEPLGRGAPTREATTRVERLLGRAPQAEAEGAAVLLIHAEGGRISLRIDVAGGALHQRGYREEQGMAPMRETLAAGLLALARHDPGLPLLDPFCGSGTLAIEGAWRALKRAPGLGRRCLFEAFPVHDAAAWAREQAEAQGGVLKALPSPVLLSDVHAGAVGVARRNARRAGLEGLLVPARADALAAPVKPLPLPPGLLVANLPYGKRVGETQDLSPLLASLGRTWRTHAAGWRFALLAPEQTEWERLGIAPLDLHLVDNGGLPCALALGAVPARETT